MSPRCFALLIVCVVSLPARAGESLLRFSQPSPIQVGWETEVHALLDHPSGLPFRSWTFGVCHDPEVIQPQYVSAGVDVDALNGGSGPEFFDSEVFPEGWQVSVVTSFTGEGLPVGEALDLHTCLYVAIAEGSSTLEYCSAWTGDPSFTDTSGTEEIPPTDPGEIFVASADPENYTLNLAAPSVRQVGGAAFDTVVYLDFTTGLPVQGWQLGVCQQGAAIDLQSLELGTDVPPSPDFVVLEEVSGGWIGAVVVDFTGTTSLLPGPFQQLFFAEYLPLTEGQVSLCFCDTLSLPGGPPVAVWLTSDGVTFAPIITPCEEIEVQDLRRRMYWTDRTTVDNTIESANLDGTDIDTVFVGGIQNPEGIIVDRTLNRVYWTEAGGTSNGRIRSVDIYGADPQALVFGLVQPRGIDVDADGGHIFWAEASGRIGRCALDGSGQTILIDDAAASFSGLRLDTRSDRLYFTNLADGSIERCHTDGSMRETVVTGLSNPLDVDFERFSGKLFWTEAGADAIRSANFDGSGLQTIATASDCHAIAVDPVTDRVYWSEGNGTSTIRSAELDGSDLATEIAGGIGEARGLALSFRPPPLDIDDYVLRLDGPATPDVDTEFTVRSLLDFPYGVGITGWSWGAATLGANIEVLSVELGADALAVDPEFHITHLHPGEGWVGAAIVSFTLPTTLGPGSDREMFVAEYDALAPGPAQLCYSDALHDPPFPISVVHGGVSYRPHDECLDLDVQAASAAFLRGDLDGSGSQSIADAILGLGMLFEGLESPCPLAADVNDDELFDTADIIYLLDWLFNSGPAPLGPADACGDDPTPGSLPCEASGSCP